MSKLIALTLAAALGGCASESAEVVPHHLTVAVAEPELMPVAPGVSVVADADKPVFYEGNAYWLYHDNHWYKSSDYRHGWIQIATPPDELRGIDEPQAYVHYRRTQENARREQNRPTKTNTGDTDRGGNGTTEEDQPPFHPIPDKIR